MDIKNKERFLTKRLKRLDFLADLFEKNGFDQIANEIRCLQTYDEVYKFFNVLKGWIL